MRVCSVDLDHIAHSQPISFFDIERHLDLTQSADREVNLTDAILNWRQFPKRRNRPRPVPWGRCSLSTDPRATAWAFSETKETTWTACMK
jgi:hypothetical protein